MEEAHEGVKLLPSWLRNEREKEWAEFPLSPLRTQLQ
jgi:hypothetical protein